MTRVQCNGGHAGLEQRLARLRWHLDALRTLMVLHVPARWAKLTAAPEYVRRSSALHCKPVRVIIQSQGPTVLVYRPAVEPGDTVASAVDELIRLSTAMILAHHQ